MTNIMGESLLISLANRMGTGWVAGGGVVYLGNFGKHSANGA